MNILILWQEHRIPKFKLNKDVKPFKPILEKGILVLNASLIRDDKVFPVETRLLKNSFRKWTKGFAKTNYRLGSSFE